MIFYKSGSTFFIRMEIGEEIIITLTAFCRENNIHLGHFTAIGAVSRAVTGLYNVSERQYYKTEIEGPLEIASLMGNITSKDGEVYIHAHAMFSNLQCEVKGGHLSEAVVSATCEMVVTECTGDINRRVCEKTGLNIFDL